jgi:hypothetical protein
MDQSKDRELTGAEEARRRPTADQLRAEIERTRAEMDVTVDAIGAKLKPARIAHEGWEAVKSRSERGAMQLIRMARENPIPAALVGAGVTFLVVRRAQRSGAAAGARRAMGTAVEGARQGASRVGGAVGQAAHRVSDAAGQAGEKVGALAGTVKEQAVGLGQRARHGARHAGEGFWDLVQRRPLLAGVATVAAGALVGLAIPASRREDELMGGRRDELFEDARDAGRRTLHRAKETVRSAARGVVSDVSEAEPPR